MAKPKTSGHGLAITALTRNIAWATSLINNQVFTKETPYADDALVLLAAKRFSSRATSEKPQRGG